jgi:hypothetical protein
MLLQVIFNELSYKGFSGRKYLGEHLKSLASKCKGGVGSEHNLILKDIETEKNIYIDNI